MTTWQYWIAWYGTNVGFGDGDMAWRGVEAMKYLSEQDGLNYLGSGGWELLSVVSYDRPFDSAPTDHYTTGRQYDRGKAFYLKRPVPSPVNT